jgi:hypothetical protein
MRSQRNPSERFLHRVRNRLWAREILDLIARAAWVSAALLLAAGTLHVTQRGHSGLVALVAAAAVPTLALVFGLLARRPGPTSAARSADRWFGGKSLMTSALDQLGRAPAERAGAAGFVLERADGSAVSWQGRLSLVSPLLPARRLVLPLLLAGAGAYLYLLPGADPGEAPRAAAEETGDEAGAPEMDQGEEDAAGLLVWHQAATERDPDSASSAAHRAETVPTAAPLGAGHEAPAEELSPLPGAETTARAPLDPAAAPNQAAGSRPGSSRAHREEFLGPGVPLQIEVSYVEIARAEADPGLGSSGTPLETRSPGGAPPVESAAAAARQGRVPARAALAPALRGYVAEFLNQIREHPR